MAMRDDTKRVNKAFRWLLWMELVDDKKTFAEKLGSERSHVTKVLNGHLPFSNSFVNMIIAKFPGIFNATWLKNGTGEMLVDNSSFPTYTRDVSGSGSGSDADVGDKPMAEIYSIFRLDVEMLRDEVRQKYSELEREIKSVSDDLTKKIEKIKIVRHYPMESGAFQEINKAAEESQNPED
jgi:hypothetical protein